MSTPEIKASIADMMFARQTHLDWAEHVEDRTHRRVQCLQCEARGYPVDAAYEREWVAKYDRVLSLLAQVKQERPALFDSGTFTLHSGERSNFKIDCDRLSVRDFVALSNMLRDRVEPFSLAEGVPRGGLAWAEVLNRGGYCSENGPLLIVDDVLTTGASMEAQRAGRDAIGAVIFARGPCPSWVTPLFRLTGSE